MNSKIADGLLLLVAIIWGGGFPAVGLAVQEGVGAGQLITLRFLIAGGVLAIVFRKQLLDHRRGSRCVGWNLFVYRIYFSNHWNAIHNGI